MALAPTWATSPCLKINMARARVLNARRCSASVILLNFSRGPRVVFKPSPAVAAEETQHTRTLNSRIIIQLLWSLYRYVSGYNPSRTVQNSYMDSLRLVLKTSQLQPPGSSCCQSRGRGACCLCVFLCKFVRRWWVGGWGWGVGGMVGGGGGWGGG